MFEKAISMIVIFVILLTSVFSNTYAMNTNNVHKPDEYKCVRFQNQNNSGKSDSEIIKEKMNAANISDAYFNYISKNIASEIKNATEIITITSYYIESSEGEMVKTSSEQYKSRVKAVKEMQRFEKEKRIDEINRSGGAFVSNGNSAVFNGGTLNIAVVLVTSNGTDYSCSGLFQWETLPSKRHKDAFGLSRDTNTSVYANTAFGEYAITHEYSFMSGLTYQTSESTSYTHVSFNELEASSTGYAFEYTIPIDSHDEQYPYSSFVYTEIAGGLTYEGHVTQPSVTTSVNHWATYAHQKLSLLFNGINFSYPFNMGFTITFGFAYDQLIDEHLWLR